MKVSDIPDQLGITKTQLAEMLGVSRQNLNQYMSGDRGKPNKFLANLISVCGLNVEQVVFTDRFDNVFAENPENPAYWLNLALEALNEAEKRGADISGIVDAIFQESEKYLPEYFADDV